MHSLLVTVLFNLSKPTVTLSKLGGGGIQDSQVFTIAPRFSKIMNNNLFNRSLVSLVEQVYPIEVIDNSFN